MITVGIIAKDEERAIERCLDSIRGEDVEVLVLDNGSKDNTVMLARNHAVKPKIYHEEKRIGFDQLRNRLIMECSTKWLVFIDADEWFPSGSLENLMRTLRSEDAGELPGYRYKVVDVGQEGWYPSPERVLNIEKSPRYAGAIHEYIAHPKVDRTGFPLILDVSVMHDGYEPEIFLEKKKAERNLELLRSMLLKEPCEPRWYYYLFRDYFGGFAEEESEIYLQSFLRISRESSMWIEAVSALLYSAACSWEARRILQLLNDDTLSSGFDREKLLLNIRIRRENRLREALVDIKELVDAYADLMESGERCQAREAVDLVSAELKDEVSRLRRK